MGWGWSWRVSARQRGFFCFGFQEHRQAEFLHTKQQIILCMGELEHTPDTSFERDVVCEDEDTFCLSKENLAALKDLLQQVGRVGVLGSVPSASTPGTVFS